MIFKNSKDKNLNKNLGKSQRYTVKPVFNKIFFFIPVILAYLLILGNKKFSPTAFQSRVWNYIKRSIWLKLNAFPHLYKALNIDGACDAPYRL